MYTIFKENDNFTNKYKLFFNIKNAKTLLL